MKYTPINFGEKLKTFSERWSPKIIAQLNDYQFKLVKIKGEFTWHSHEDTDEVFICLQGKMAIEFRQGVVQMKEGELFVVPKGKEHRPVAKEECSMLLVEPEGVVNTGDNPGELTADDDVWI
ncbi:MAG: cupin domain-containing protein [Desulfobacteraceae bacterium]|nr:cupin domain-containing protein [Desulfobacteraceae bacterium]